MREGPLIVQRLPLPPGNTPYHMKLLRASNVPFSVKRGGGDGKADYADFGMVRMITHTRHVAA
jgi:hypothetical protein